MGQRGAHELSGPKRAPVSYAAAMGLPLGRMPDPRRVHGAWIYLFIAVAAGAFVGAEGDLVPSLLAGTTFAGLFLLAAALAIGRERGARPLLIGAVLSLTAPLAALALGSGPSFLLWVLASVPAAVAALFLALRHGWLAPSALAAGVVALTLAAPASAQAGGASAARSAILFAVLLAFNEWRTLRISLSLRAGAMLGELSAETFRTQGLREAALALGWAALTLAWLA